MAQVKRYNHTSPGWTFVTVNVGDVVCFKSDVEQAGRITAISGDRLTLENPNRFDGGYIGGETVTVQRAGDCWSEG